MAKISIEEKFPNLTPISGAPTLFTLNGCGTTIYGQRDFDPETGTYVKTMVLCVAFIPIFALRAYRVADAAPGEGWFFLGREPLSGLAKAWNCVVPCLVAAGIAAGVWSAHTNSPEYRAGVLLAAAKEQAARGEKVAAAKSFRVIAAGNTPHAKAALTEFCALLDGALATGGAEEITAIVAEAVTWPNAPRSLEFCDLPERCRLAAERLASGGGGAGAGTTAASGDAVGALAVLDAVAPMLPDDKAREAAVRPLLERIIPTLPADADPAPAVRLALMLETEGKTDKCRGLLAPRAARLGDGEGARILGRMYAAEGRLDDAHALLVPYTETRLKRLRESEAAFEAAVKTVQERTIGSLERGGGTQQFYAQYKAADEAGKRKLVEEALAHALQASPDVAAARATLLKDAPAVGAALDLGMVLLRRGREMPDPEARRREMERAERTFLAIRGIAGDSDAFRLSLGQVYYWLGRPADGRKLFDDTLAANKRDYDTLMGLARLLRELGSPAEGRALAEEAYGKETDNHKRHVAAALRAVDAVDTDDKLAWLAKCDPADGQIRALSAECRGEKALRAGRHDEAEREFRAAAGVYAAQPETSATLNNGALAWFAAFGVSGDREDFDRGMAMMDKAVALKSDSSIVLSNAASVLFAAAIREAVAGTVDLRALRDSAGTGALRHLYSDPAGRAAALGRVRSHPGFAKAAGYLERAAVLAPKSAGIAGLLAEMRSLSGDAEGMARLLSRLEADPPDVSERTAEFMAGLAGLEDAKTGAELSEAAARAAEAVARVRPAGGATLAYACDLLAAAKTARRSLGALTQADCDEAVALAEQAHAAAPSAGTRAALAATLLARAERRLAESSPEVRAVAEKCRRSLPATYLLTAVVSRPGPARDAALKDADLRRAAGTLAESVRAVPDDAAAWEWAFLKAVLPDDPAVAAAEKEVRQDKTASAHRKVGRVLRPFDAAAALSLYWEGLALGRDTGGPAALKAVAARGVPLPFELP